MKEEFRISISEHILSKSLPFTGLIIWCATRQKVPYAYKRIVKAYISMHIQAVGSEHLSIPFVNIYRNNPKYWVNLLNKLVL